MFVSAPPPCRLDDGTEGKYPYHPFLIYILGFFLGGVANDACLRFGVSISQPGLGGEKRDRNKILPERFCFYITGRVVVVAVALGLGHGSGD